jgi:hypothetical protein
MNLPATATPAASLPSPTDSARLRTIREIVEGVYILTEWRDGSQTLDSGTVSARLVIQNGVLIWVANHFQEKAKLGYSGIGAYRLDEQMFSYGYEQLVTSLTDDEGDHINRDMPAWATDMALPAMRDFALTMEDDTVTLTNKGGIFDMRIDGCVYTDLNTKNVRVWKKVTRGE